jgi:hypothetical protein
MSDLQLCTRPQREETTSHVARLRYATWLALQKKRGRFKAPERTAYCSNRTACSKWPPRSKYLPAVQALRTCVADERVGRFHGPVCSCFASLINWRRRAGTCAPTCIEMQKQISCGPPASSAYFPLSPPQGRLRDATRDAQGPDGAPGRR